MHQNIPFAVGLVMFGSFCYALAAKVQRSAVRVQVRENTTNKRMNVRQIFLLLLDPKWWLGVGLMTVSLVCQVLGLYMAPVSVVQPVGLMAFPWSILLTARSLGPNPKRVIAPTVGTVAVIAGFVLLVSVHSSPTIDIRPARIIVAAGVVYALVGLMALLGSHGPRQWRPLFWGSGGAMLYGLEAAVVKVILEYAANHTWWQQPVIWGIIAVLLAGSGVAGLMIQQGYATGAAHVVVACTTVTAPVISVTFGIIVLAEGRLLTPGPSVGLVALGLAAIAGVALTAWVSRVALDDHPVGSAANPPKEGNQSGER
ncbi:MAG: hypothetical protein FWF36_01080 [Propionibacteriaceae bacterium]|nr:hypothetical protein [Propionibacteriaceae bacterium]